MKSILQDKKGRRCYLCMLLGDDSEKPVLQEHHIYEGTANRRNSEKYGMKVYLCPRHHVGDIDGAREAVHRPDLNNYGWALKVIAEEVFAQTHTREEFRAIFGRSWSGGNMNSVVLMGRLTKDPMVRYTQGEQQIAIARYTLAVDRRRRQGDEQTADFISCVAFGKNGEFAEKWLRKGMRICIHGRIQTGSYEKDGQKVYTMDIVADTQEFAESKSGNAERDSYYDQMAAGQSGQTAGRQQDPLSEDGFMNIPEGIDEELPFT